MRPSSVVIFLLALHFQLYGVHGARVGKFYAKSVTTTFQLIKLENKNYVVEEEDQSSTLDKILEDKKIVVKCKDNEDHCSLKGTLKRRVMSKVAIKESNHDYHHHWFPWIHEDYRGNNRKLITSPSMSTSIAKPIQENLDNGGKKMDIKRDDKAKKLSPSKHSSPPSSTHHHHTPLMAFEVDKHSVIIPPEYENAMDMTVMDYSPAKRKPPIHN